VLFYLFFIFIYFYLFLFIEIYVFKEKIPSFSAVLLSFFSNTKRARVFVGPSDRTLNNVIEIN